MDVLLELDIELAILRCDNFFPVATKGTAVNNPMQPKKAVHNKYVSAIPLSFGPQRKILNVRREFIPR